MRTQDEIKVLEAEVKRLHAELAALREDKERLDWLETKTSVTWEDGPPIYIANPIFKPVETNIRAAIDAARK